MQSSLKGLGALTLFVRDLPTARSFYGDVFGLKLIFEDESSAVFDFGNTMINLLAIGEAPELVAPATVVAGGADGVRSLLTIWVDDVEALCADLQQRGAVLVNGPIDRVWGKRTAAFADPDGNIWEIAQDLPA
jgi:catechol 2,3-dioxygenase-like lactoylglutathione lyase family enzyme